MYLESLIIRSADINDGNQIDGATLIALAHEAILRVLKKNGILDFLSSKDYKLIPQSVKFGEVESQDDLKDLALFKASVGDEFNFEISCSKQDKLINFKIEVINQSQNSKRIGTVYMQVAVVDQNQSVISSEVIFQKLQ